MIEAENGFEVFPDTDYSDFNFTGTAVYTEIFNVNGSGFPMFKQSDIDSLNEGDNFNVKYTLFVNATNAEGEPIYFIQELRQNFIYSGCSLLGDMNNDGGWNVLDVVHLSNCVLSQTCAEHPFACAGDMNGDGGWNVLDIVQLALCAMSNDNCV